MSKNISLEESMCPVCREISIEPVTLPYCAHVLCLKCFERSIEVNNLFCPMCRKRFGAWSRTITNKGGDLVNTKLWAVIQERFPKEVEAKMNDEDDGVEDRVVTSSTPNLRLSESSTIGQKLALQLRKLREEAERKEESGWQSCLALIRKFSSSRINASSPQQQQQLHPNHEPQPGPSGTQAKKQPLDSFSVNKKSA